MNTKPVVELEQAQEVITEVINSSAQSSKLNHRHKTILITATVNALAAIATVPARDGKGHFIADDPNTEEDESRAPLPVLEEKPAPPATKVEKPSPPATKVEKPKKPKTPKK